MKIRLDKPAANNFKAYRGKNEIAKRGTLHEKLRLDLYFAYRKYWIESKITECVICKQEAFNIIEILFHILYNVQQTEVISSFLFTFIIHKLWEHLVWVFTVS